MTAKLVLLTVSASTMRPVLTKVGMMGRAARMTTVIVVMMLETTMRARVISIHRKLRY